MPLVSVQVSDGSWVSESWPLGALPTPTVDGSNATYPEVLSGVDLRLTATASGMSEVLVVKTKAAASNPALANLSLSIAGAKVSMDGNRSLRAQTANGAPERMNERVESPSPTNNAVFGRSVTTCL